ncbi:MAG: hypothetical protein E7578_07795 [Ruminococcaceae bacterium]|nr:hypothetical protein [Oscillospiraceae bacterium]
MLKKLLKYEIRNTLKFLVIFYSISVIFALITRILFAFEDSSFMVYFFSRFCQGVTISMMCSALFNNLLRLWVRFRQNFYGDESYLTHTLPVTKGTHLAAKFINSVVTLCLTMVVIGICLCIMYYSNGIGEAIKSFVYPAADMYGTSIITLILVFLLILFLQFFNILQCGYTGIILGHKLNKSKIGLSVLFGGIIYMGSQIVTVLLMLIASLYDTRIIDLFTELNPVISPSLMKLIVIVSIISYTMVIIVNYLISVKLFKKGVNVE